MPESHTESLVGVSRHRARIFVMVAVVLCVVGGLFSETMVYIDAEHLVVLAAFGLLTLVAIVTALQALWNGSLVLGVVLSVAMPLGFWAMAFLPQHHSFSHQSISILYMGITFALFFGIPGHLLGGALARGRKTGPTLHKRTELALMGVWIATLLLFVSISMELF